MHMERALRKGSRMVEPASMTADLLDEVLGDLDRESKGLPPLEGVNEVNGALLVHVVNTLVSDWRNVDSLNDLAELAAELNASQSMPLELEIMRGGTVTLIRYKLD